MHTLAKQRRIFILISLAVPVLCCGGSSFSGRGSVPDELHRLDGLSPTSNFIWFETTSICSTTPTCGRACATTPSISLPTF